MPRGAISQHLQAFFFIAAESGHGSRGPQRPRQAADHVIVGTDDQFGFCIVRGEFENALMVMPGAHGVAQGREPGVLDERGVGRKLRAGNTSGIKSIDIVRIRC